MNVLITGGNSGIGFETAKQLLKIGYHVYIVCKDEKKTDETVKNLQQFGICLKAGKSLDLNDLNSVENFALYEFKLTSLNILICNAGVMGVPSLQFTKQGIESHVGINYLAHYVLTRYLIPKLLLGAKESKTFSRIVNVSSLAHVMTKNDNKVDFSLAFHGGNKEDYDYSPYYSYSKLFQIWDASYLNSKYDMIRCVSLHPGVIRTNLTRQMDPKIVESVLSDPSISISIEDGAKTTLTCVTATFEELGINSKETLYYYANSKRTRTSKLARNESLAIELQDYTQNLLKTCLNPISFTTISNL
jgi:retinol dehydrogenase-12